MDAIRFNSPASARAEGAPPRHVPASRLARVVPALGAVAMMIVIGGFYVFREHLAPGGTAWLYLLLLACPMIHLCAQGGSSGTEADGHDPGVPMARADTRRDADRDEPRERP